MLRVNEKPITDNKDVFQLFNAGLDISKEVNLEKIIELAQRMVKEIIDTGEYVDQEEPAEYQLIISAIDFGVFEIGYFDDSEHKKYLESIQNQLLIELHKLLIDAGSKQVLCKSDYDLEIEMSAADYVNCRTITEGESERHIVNVESKIICNWSKNLDSKVDSVFEPV